LLLFFKTKRLKQEKEAKLVKAKKARDNFLVMLAEHTNIDYRTRWSEASALLRDDPRFRAVADSHEREDLFSDFTGELAKKDKQDRAKARESANAFLTEKFEQLYKHGIITRKSLWMDCKDDILPKVFNTFCIKLRGCLLLAAIYVISYYLHKIINRACCTNHKCRCGICSLL